MRPPRTTGEEPPVNGNLISLTDHPILLNNWLGLYGKSGVLRPPVLATEIEAEQKCVPSERQEVMTHTHWGYRLW